MMDKNILYIPEINTSTTLDFRWILQMSWVNQQVLSARREYVHIHERVDEDELTRIHILAGTNSSESVITHRMRVAAKARG
jgi:hypothetical protein